MEGEHEQEEECPWSDEDSDHHYDSDSDHSLKGFSVFGNEVRDIENQFAKHLAYEFIPQNQSLICPSLLDTAAGIVGKSFKHIEMKTMIPTHFSEVLLRNALLSENFTLVMDILSSWPDKKLDVQLIFKDWLGSTRILYDKCFREDLERKLERITLLTLDSFFECLRSDSLQHLRIIDITGMSRSRQMLDMIIPSGEKVQAFLQAQVEMVNNSYPSDAQHKYTVQSYMNIVLDFLGRIKHRWTGNNGVVHIDPLCFECSFSDTEFHGVNDLLAQMDLENARIFRYDYHAIVFRPDQPFECEYCLTPLAISMLQSRIKRMVSLTHFELQEFTCEDHQAQKQELLSNAIADCVTAFRKLRSLNLQEAEIGGHLERVLNQLPPLDVLILPLSLTVQDLRHLTDWVHLSKLSYLNIYLFQNGQGGQSNSLALLANLLYKAVSLKVLKVRTDKDSEKEINTLSEPIAGLQNLQVLIFGNCTIQTPRALMSIEFLKVCCLPHLEFLAVPAPIENQPMFSMEEIECDKWDMWFYKESKRFLDVFQVHVATARNRLGLDRCYICTGSRNDLSEK